MPRWCIDRLVKPQSTRIEDFYREKSSKDAWPPGILGIPAWFLGRYREFEICLTNLILPPGTQPAWGIGSNTAKNMNDMARRMLKDDTFEWLWIIGDDHTFPPDIVLQLLKRDRDVVVPFCCRRNYPYIPVVHDNGGDQNWYPTVEYEWFNGKSGLVNLNETDKLAGNAGMLIKRSVFEILEPPWFEMGQINSEYGSPDLWFAKKVVDAGFDIWLDMDHPIGHLSHMAVWPFKNPATGEWKAEVRYPDDVWGERGLIVD